MTVLGGSSTTTMARTSQPWTEADNAAGFVLRYLVSMREQLLLWTGNEAIADESLKRLISHLVTQGFGTNGKGRIRDFLMRGIRSATKSVIAEMPDAKRPPIDLASWTLESPVWLATWRKGLLARAWRSLERVEHKDESKPFYSILRAATEHPEEDAAMLAIRINTKSDIRIEPETIREHLLTARILFAQLLKHEIAETLAQVDDASVDDEIAVLGLSGIFASPKL